MINEYSLPLFLGFWMGVLLGVIAAMIFGSRRDGESYEISRKRQGKIVGAFIIVFTLAGLVASVIVSLPMLHHWFF